jgi:hypothetical protein
MNIQPCVFTAGGVVYLAIGLMLWAFGRNEAIGYAFMCGAAGCFALADAREANQRIADLEKKLADRDAM